MRYKEYIELAEMHEVKSFINDDPIQFCYKYSNKKDIEIAGIISSWLAYGMRKVFMPKIDSLLTKIMNNKPYEYIMNGDWNLYKDDYSCLYRMTTWHNLAMLCEKLRVIYLNNKDLEEATLNHFVDRSTRFKFYYQSLCDLLSGESMIPTAKSMSANKRMNMFLRWMIRNNSDVDLGLWKSFKKSNLLIPCDVHVLKSARELGLISKVEETQRVVIKLTDYAKKIFDTDPSRMDFALYGYGINKLNK